MPPKPGPRPLAIAFTAGLFISACLLPWIGERLYWPAIGVVTIACAIVFAWSLLAHSR